ncbi:MAG: flagellar biosynthesis protein [Pararhodobacter sp.]
MPQPLRLEVFETPEVPDGPVFLMPEEVEELRLNAYERGYGAGWEDAGRQADAEESARKAAFARQAEQLTFTYHEARGHLLNALRPLLTAMLERVIPEAARVSVVPMVVEQLMPLATASLEAPITLRIAPGSRADFDAAFEGLVLPPLDIVESADLAEGQAAFTFEALETRIDLDHVAESLRRAVERFYQLQSDTHGQTRDQPKETRHA